MESKINSNECVAIPSPYRCITNKHFTRDAKEGRESGSCFAKLTCWTV